MPDLYMVIDHAGKIAGPFNPRQLMFLDETGELQPGSKVRNSSEVDARWSNWSDLRGEVNQDAAQTPKDAGNAVSLIARPSRWTSQPIEPYRENSHPRSRSIYIILALLLGSIGIHNLYAGHTNRGIAQMFLTLAGFVVLLLVGILGLFFNFAAGVWAIVDIVSVSEDGDGNPMR